MRRAFFFVALLPGCIFAQTASPAYTKTTYMIPMRDGKKLCTIVYTPKDKPGKHPILLQRTPYSVGPYDEGMRGLAGSKKFQEAGYIFAFQDVRGRWNSEGDFADVRPINPNPKGTETDEATDAYDTADFLVKTVPDNNGNIGVWGISYPGFYAGASAIRTHPAIKAVSPQAPVSDWFIGDDMHHNGAFFLQDSFDFFSGFGVVRPGPITKPIPGVPIDRKGANAYDFFLSTGAIPNFDKLHYQGRVPWWNQATAHSNYDAFWKARSLPPQMRGVNCAVLVVGGWFDAEDLWGALNLYRATDRQNPGRDVSLVMGPWSHGMWARQDGQFFNDLDFGQATSRFYQDEIEFPFFDRYLRGSNLPKAPEAYVFETGANQWHKFETWPPKGVRARSVYLDDERRLSNAAPRGGTEMEIGGDYRPGGLVYNPNGPLPGGLQFSFMRDPLSRMAGYYDLLRVDPSKPTPYQDNLGARRNSTYMVDDQRFAQYRLDVMDYSGPVLDKDWHVAGPIDVDFWVATTGTDMDLVVKVIDVWPDTEEGLAKSGRKRAGYQQLLRGDVFRCKFRESFSNPKPMIPGVPTRVKFRLPDVMHSFKKGHRLMIQVQSSWFPLVDRNPNVFLDIYKAKDSDFKPAVVSILRANRYPSKVTFLERS
ncbi:MAG: CocE/NonD family hydrolase [Armatimonadetes bacterium]|nr:CocE/NonD family hydrolase [Armatimonadota bacterium]